MVSSLSKGRKKGLLFREKEAKSFYLFLYRTDSLTFAKVFWFFFSKKNILPSPCH